MRTAVVFLVALSLTACGTYRITYRMPSRVPELAYETQSGREVPAPPVKKRHRHGIGLIGGGGYFFAFSQIFPALIDYTGTQQVSGTCPEGIYELSHGHTFGQNAAAAVISWVLILNWVHNSDELWTCAASVEEVKNS